MPRSEEQFQEIRDKTKNLILEKSLQLFAQRGYNGTSMSQIAKAAGISKGLAYNYFDSKQDLMISIVNQIGEFVDVIENEMLKFSDPQVKLKVLILSSFKYVKDNEEYWKLYTSFALQPDIMEIGRKVMEKFMDRLFKRIESIFTDLNVKEPYTEARYLGALLDGMTIHYYIYNEKYPLEDIKKMIMKRYDKEGIDKLK